MAKEPSVEQMKSELTKKGKAEKPLHYQPAPPMSRADIAADAERIARQVSGEDNPQGMTQQQIARNADLDVDIRGKKKAKINPIDFEKFKGAYSVGVPGDPSRGGLVPSRPTKGIKEPKAGEYLHGIGGEQLERPVPLYGGKDYGAYGGPAGWASDLGASAGMFNVVKKLATENPETPILGHYHKMSPESLNHAVHMMDAVMTYHRPHEAPPEQIEKLNHLMRNVATTTAKEDVPYPEFPGFEKPAEVMLHGAMNSGMRKKLIGLLGTQKYFPGGKQKVEDIVHAISHPELRNLETGAGGHAILKFDPSKSLRDTISSHPTYAHDIPSELIGKTKYPTPFRILAPRSHHNAMTEIAAMGKKVNPFNLAKMNIIREPIDEQYINQMGEYEQMMRKLLGHAEGGNVKAEHIKKLMAMRPYFEEQAKRKQAYNDYAKTVYPQHQKTYSEWAQEQGYHTGPSQDEMLAYVMLHKADGGSVDLANVGVEEAPDMPVKAYISPGPQRADQMPVGGVDMIPVQPGQQLMPSPSPGGMPQPPGQPPSMQIPQDGPPNPLAQVGSPKGTPPMGAAPMGMPTPPQGGMPQGVQPSPKGPQPTSMSNLLNLTRPGQALNAMKPMARMAKGGAVDTGSTAAKAPIGIDALGDSTTYGWNHGQQSSNNMITAASKLLGDNVTINNLGKPSTTLGDLLSSDSFGSVLNNKNPVVILNYGMNEAYRGENPDDFKSNLLTAVQQLQDAGKKVILQTPNKPNSSEGWEGNVGNYADIISQVAKQTNSALDDKYSTPITYAEDDTIHPDEAGYGVLGKNLYSTISSVLNPQASTTGTAAAQNTPESTIMDTVMSTKPKYSFDASNPYVGTNITLRDGQVVPYNDVVQQVLKRYEEDQKNPTLAVKSGLQLGIPDEILQTLPGVDAAALAGGHSLIDTGAFVPTAVNRETTPDDVYGQGNAAPVGSDMYNARLAAGLDAYGLPQEQVAALTAAGKYTPPNAQSGLSALDKSVAANPIDTATTMPNMSMPATQYADASQVPEPDSFMSGRLNKKFESMPKFDYQPQDVVFAKGGSAHPSIAHMIHAINMKHRGTAI